MKFANGTARARKETNRPRSTPVQFPGRGGTHPLWTIVVSVSDKTISGPELKTALTGLGLTPKWFAGRLNISMRTVVRWFDQDKIPETAARELDQVHSLTRSEMRGVLEGWESTGVVRTFRCSFDITPDHKLPSEYAMPASWHRALSFRVLEHLRASGKEGITVDYWD